MENLPDRDNYMGKHNKVRKQQIGLGKEDLLHFPEAEKTQERK